MIDTENIIEIHNLVKTYKIGGKRIRVLKGVNLSVEKGEFISILGPSGSGKSTLMNIIGSLEEADSGFVSVCGKKLTKMTEKEIAHYRNKTVGFVFQSFNLINSLTALENAALPLLYGGVSGKERYEKAEKALSLVGLSDRRNHKPCELSGGQKQRVAIARAIVTEPSIILADEPTGNLDLRCGEQIMKLLLRLCSEGYTVIMVTHNRTQTKYGTRTIEISDGRIERDELTDRNIPQ